jgi:hypothetical protein
MCQKVGYGNFMWFNLNKEEAKGEIFCTPEEKTEYFT